MPDVFVANDKPNDESVVMHKRAPLASSAEENIVQQSDPASHDLQTPEKIVKKDFIEEEKKEFKETTTVPEEKPSSTKVYIKEEPFSQNTNNISSNEGSEEILVDDAEKRNAVPILTSFWQNPQGVYFDTQEANEHILLFLRRHFITNLPWIFMTILFLFLPLAVNYLVSATNFSLAIFPAPFVTASIFMYYLLVITAGFLRFLDWYFNISLITARRVMDIELKDLVYKKISATKISLVQDVNYQQAGTIRTVFNYGDVLVQTAGAVDNFFIHAVPKPEIVVEVMEAIIGKGREEKENAPL